MSNLELTAQDNPFEIFDQWFELAKQSEPDDPNAMCLATATPDGKPSARMVLLKDHDERGFVFYTNLESRKGSELADNPHASVCFHWKSLHRQIRIEGKIEQVSDAQADDYYNSRHRGSRIGAWASKQSRPLDSRDTLKQRVEDFDKKFEGQENIPRPAHWSGFRLKPSRIEFWDDGTYRLHDRFIFEKIEASWTCQRYYP